MVSYFIWCHLISYDPIWYDPIWFYPISSDVLWSQLISSDLIYKLISSHIIWYDLIFSPAIIWSNFTSSDLFLSHLISYDLIWTQPILVDPNQIQLTSILFYEPLSTYVHLSVPTSTATNLIPNQDGGGHSPPKHYAQYLKIYSYENVPKLLDFASFTMCII